MSDLLSRILQQLYFISFFPDHDLNEEILEIMYYLEIVFRIYHMKSWIKVTQLIRSHNKPNWLSFGTFDFLRFKWTQWKIQRRIGSLQTIYLDLSETQVDLLQNTYHDLTEIQIILHKTRPVVYNLIKTKFY
jgi:hypothetical protein